MKLGLKLRLVVGERREKMETTGKEGFLYGNLAGQLPDRVNVVMQTGAIRRQ